MTNESTAPLLIELGLEELPPDNLETLIHAFATQMGKNLKAADISFSKIENFATPRRLALIIQDCASQQPTQQIERTGPSVKAAFDTEGKPTPAGLGFAKSCGIDIADCESIQTDKGEKLFYRSEQVGQTLEAILPSCLQATISRLPMSKPMRWQDHDFSFIRPLHWLCVMHGSTVMNLSLFAKQASNLTYGHRYHAPDALVLTHASQYSQRLTSQGFVLPDFSQRKELIREQIHKVAAQQSARPIIDEALLNKVTAMVEWPVALLGTFEKTFLSVPKEALIAAIKGHQSCFHLVDDNDNLLPHFITISNIQSKEPQKVIHGNERVMRARLADATFFYQTDLNESMQAWNEKLSHVTFEEKLGSLADKVSRIETLANYLAKTWGADQAQVLQAATLCKTDLMSNTVYEFPELQGVMGYYYAKHAGQDDVVATAIVEHYKPAFASDDIPDSLPGKIIAVADRIDTLVGIFGIGKEPTGDKDPFALRRAAIGILRILTEGKLILDLRTLIEVTIQGYKQPLSNPNTLHAVHDFLIDRFMYFYHEKGFEISIIKSALAVQNNFLYDLLQRMIAVDSFCQRPSAKSLASANKRVRNLLNKQNISAPLTVETSLLQASQEKELFNAIETMTPIIQQASQEKDYANILSQLSTLESVVDAFFEQVLVNVEDSAIKQNRLALLQRLQQLFLHVADISILHIAGK